MMGDGEIRSGAVMDGFYPSATVGVRLDAEDTRCSNCGRCFGDACRGANFDIGL
jgi:hypothetical protein